MSTILLLLICAYGNAVSPAQVDGTREQDQADVTAELSGEGLDDSPFLAPPGALDITMSEFPFHEADGTLYLEVTFTNKSSEEGILPASWLVGPRFYPTTPPSYSVWITVRIGDYLGLPDQPEDFHPDGSLGPGEARTLQYPVTFPAPMPPMSFESPCYVCLRIWRGPRYPDKYTVSDPIAGLRLIRSTAYRKNDRVLLRPRGEQGDVPPRPRRTLDFGAGVNIEFVRIEPGSFWMGQGDGYAKMIRHGSNRLPTTDGPAHQVQITQPFYFSVYEITAAQWQHVMGSLPEGYDDSPDCPITRTSWNEATAFCRKVSGMVELDVRLPKEKEWEYCAIAGDPYPAAAHHKCWLGNCWDLLSSDARLHPVGQKTPNPWGIFDLLGNASEMCESRFERYPGSEFSVPARFQRVIRGGSYKKNGPTPKYRIGIQEEEKREDLGFRLVLSVSSDE